MNVSLPSPVGGLNALNTLDDMPETDAIELNNWIPGPGACTVREGSVEFADTGTGSPVGTIISYGMTLIAATGGKLIDVTNPQSQTDLGTGFTGDRWQWAVSNDKLVMVNGLDAPQQWDGTTLSAVSFTSGVTNAYELIGITIFKGRAFYWKDSEAGFYYAAAGAYQGVMEYFDLSPFVSRKALIKTAFTWSADAGDGVDDFAVFVMDTGEALMYQGSDPSSASDWALVGKYEMGRPLSVRGDCGLIGDRVVLSSMGWVNFRSVTQVGTLDTGSIGQKIVNLAHRVARQIGETNHWEVAFLDSESLVIVNVPQSINSSYVQHVLNLQAGGWCTFSGWNATTIGEFNSRMYYGTPDGKVMLAFEGYDDAGEPITATAVPAYTHLGDRSVQKQLTGLRPITTALEPKKISLVPSADYKTPRAENPGLQVRVLTSTPWGSPWGSPWSVEVQAEASGVWRSINKFGFALSFRMGVKTKGQEVEWLATNYMFKPGGAV